MSVLVIDHNTTIDHLGLDTTTDLETLARRVADDTFDGEPIDWEQLWTELDSTTVNGHTLDIRADLSPVQQFIRTVIEQGI